MKIRLGTRLAALQRVIKLVAEVTALIFGEDAGFHVFAGLAREKLKKASALCVALRIVLLEFLEDGLRLETLW